MHVDDVITPQMQNALDALPDDEDRWREKKGEDPLKAALERAPEFLEIYGEAATNQARVRAIRCRIQRDPAGDMFWSTMVAASRRPKRDPL